MREPGPVLNGETARAIPAASDDTEGVRILVVAPEPFYEDRGTPIAVRHVLHALSELGYRVDVLTFPIGRSLDIPGVRYIRLPNPVRIRTVPIGFSFRKLWFDAFLFFAILRQLRTERYACIHAVEESAFLAVVASGGRVPVIYDMQSSLAEQMSHLAGFRNRWAKAVCAAAERWLIRRADFIGCSLGLAVRVRAAHPAARLREWWYPCPQDSVSAESVARLRQELRIRSNQPVVMYTGNFKEYQGLPILVQAIPAVLARIPETVFVFVGAKEGVASEAERQLAATVPAASYRVLHRQPKPRIAAFLAMSDIVVSPRTLGTNLPLKILEYLAAGRAIVAADAPVHHSVLSSREAVLCAPTPHGIARAIAGLLANPDRIRELQGAARRYAQEQLGWLSFLRAIGQLYEAAIGDSFFAIPHAGIATSVSVVIPVRNAAALIAETIGGVRAQQGDGMAVDVIVVDDGSTDETAEIARGAGARIVTREAGQLSGNPAAARNLGAAAATGEFVVFLDADCRPRPGWLRALLAAHARGAVCVGGALALPPGLPLSARLDYYCGWYHVHEHRPLTQVRHHPPCNLSVRRSAFAVTSGFTEAQPIAYAHEELVWQAELHEKGDPIVFAPLAVVDHWNRPGFGNLLRRNYRWAYCAIESKASNRLARWSWLYRLPCIAVLASVPSAPLQAIYITGCWLRAGVLEVVWLFPFILAARIAYGVGMAVGGVRWLTRPPAGAAAKPRWA